MKEIVEDVLVLTGFAMISASAFLCSIALGLLVLGCVFLVVAFAVSQKKVPSK